MQSILILLSKSFAIGIFASIPLCPVLVLCIRRNLSRGLLSGFLSGMGAAVGDALYALIAIMGLSFIINFIESQQIFLRAAGGVVLLVLGIRIFYSDPGKLLNQGEKKTGSHFNDFFSILVLMLTNPVAILVFIAVFASLKLVQPNPGPLLSGIVIGGILTGASVYWLLFNSVIDRYRDRFNISLMLNINKVSGTIIFIIGIVAIISGYFVS